MREDLRLKGQKIKINWIEAEALPLLKKRFGDGVISSGTNGAGQWSFCIFEGNQKLFVGEAWLSKSKKFQWWLRIADQPTFKD